MTKDLFKLPRPGAKLLAACILLAASSARAQLLGVSAWQGKAGSWKGLLFYQGVQSQDLNFSVAGTGSCVGVAAPNVAFPCSVGGANVRALGDGGAIVAKLLFQPYESMQYYAWGGVGDYGLRVDAGTAVNRVTGSRKGLLYGIGTRATIWPLAGAPQTLAVPAIAVDGSLGWQTYYFDTLRPVTTAPAGQINQRLDLMQLQLALEASRLFRFEGTRWALEPYGGLKWYRTHAWLKDYQTGDRQGGIQDTVTPFTGLNIPLFAKESVFAEASFVNGVQYAAGLNIAFGK